LGNSTKRHPEIYQSMITGVTQEEWFLLALVIASISVAVILLFINNKQSRRIIELETQLNGDQLIHKEREHAWHDANERLRESFALLSRDALDKNSEAFLKLAEENLKQHTLTAKGDLEKSEKAIETLLKPINDALKKTGEQIHNIEKERKQAFGSLSQQLKSVTETQNLLQNETRNLVNALRRPEVRGQWGEITLKRLAELAGMVEHCDFFEQEHITTEEGTLRPDMIVRMPEQREIVIDAKTPLDAYLTAIEAKDENERQLHMSRHAKNVRERVRELSAKAYWSQFKNTPEFVVLFIPGDQFLATALEQDHELLEDALSSKVILATPTSFVALLRAIAYGWRQVAVAKNAEHICLLAEELYKRLATFVDHLSKIGKGLKSSTDAYNSAVGSLERQVLPGARKFTELGILEKKALQELEQLETQPRTINKPTK